jgi:ribosome assembly protein RRB1
MEDLKEEIKDKGELAFDNSAYEMLHKVNLEWPCLSIDFVLPDRFESNFDQYNPGVKLPNSLLVDYTDPVTSQKSKRHKEDKYPYKVYMVGGTQTDAKSKVANKLYVMKLYDMYKTQYDDQSESDDDPDNFDDDPNLLFEWVPLKAAINRVRTMNYSSITALWNEAGEVAIYDLTPLFLKLNAKKVNNKKKSKKNLKDVKLKICGFNHTQEGYALDWSPLKKGFLASGGQDTNIHLYIPSDSTLGDWQMTDSPLKGHNASVEDIQWSPSEESVMASCSVDTTVKIWDIRANSNSDSQITIPAHETDVNVIAWNPACTYLLASGGDDGAFKVWDLRYLKRGGAITNIKWHSGQITSLQFQPREESVLAVASSDNRLTIWDFGVEKDEEAKQQSEDKDIPQQLMFLHQGQDDIKELRFHPYYDCMIASTANDGLNLFRPNFSPVPEDSDSEDEGGKREAKVEEEMTDN